MEDGCLTDLFKIVKIEGKQRTQCSSFLVLTLSAPTFFTTILKFGVIQRILVEETQTFFEININAPVHFLVSVVIWVDLKKVCRNVLIKMPFVCVCVCL